MKRLDEGKASLVDFLRSIKYTGRHASKPAEDFPAQFAGFTTQTRAGKNSNAEELQLIRSAN